MSVNYHAYVVYGVQVDKNWLYETTSKRGCSHKSIEGARFCPECGKPTTIDGKELTLEFGDSTELSFFGYTYEAESVVVGFCMSEADDFSDTHAISTVRQPSEEQKEELLIYCKQMNIKLDPDEPCLFNVLFCSY